MCECFLVPYIARGEWTEWLMSDGSVSVAPSEYDGDMPDDWHALGRVRGYGACLSADGYLDATEWTVHATPADAARYLIDTYYDDGVCDTCYADLSLLAYGDVQIGGAQ